MRPAPQTRMFLQRGGREPPPPVPPVPPTIDLPSAIYHPVVACRIRPRSSHLFGAMVDIRCVYLRPALVVRWKRLHPICCVESVKLCYKCNICNTAKQSTEEAPLPSNSKTLTVLLDTPLSPTLLYPATF